MHDWIISDTHFNHVNIVEYAGRPKNHNELIQDNWRRLIRPHQTILHLGDVLMGKQELWDSMPGWLPGSIDVLSTGNHDEPHKKQWLQAHGWHIVPEFSIEYRGWTILFSHYPEWVVPLSNDDNTAVGARLDLIPARSINVHGHIHEKKAPSKYHINVSVEQIGYSPVDLKSLLDGRIEMLENVQ